MIRAHYAPPDLLDEIIASLVEKYRPRRIYLFGSRARGDARRESDYDFLIEVERTPEGHGQTRQGITWLEGFPGTEIQVHIRYPGQLERKKDDPGTIDWDVIREGRVLFAAEGLPPILPGPRRGIVRERRHDFPPSLTEWLRLAGQDIELARHLAGDLDKWKEPICFHCQQAAEKFLKALIISQWERPPLTHALRDLLGIVRLLGFDLAERGQDCFFLSRFAVSGRYPDDDDPFTVAEGIEISTEDARNALAAAERVVGSVRPHLA